MSGKLLDELAVRPLLCDGATGTQLQQMGLPPGTGGESWNLERPDRIRELHRRYLGAGANMITTNSFGGNSLVLAASGLAEKVGAINRLAAQLARELAGGRAWVLGDVGPCGGLLEPYGEVAPASAAASFRGQIDALLEGGADAILVETMSDPEEAALAINAARSAGAHAVIATFAFQRTAVGYRTLMGTTVAEAVRRGIEAGADVVGANCGTELSLADYETLTRELTAAAGRCPVIVQPNAGSPVLIDGTVSYRQSAAEFAAAVPRLLAAGARIVGGCCGSTPEHIAAMAPLLRPGAN